MNCRLLWNTIKYLKVRQILFQVMNRVHKPAYKVYDLPFAVDDLPKGLKTEPIARYKCLEGSTFTFLNLEHEFAGWNFTDNGMLWAYNQNYFDWLNQKDITQEEGCKWIDCYISTYLTDLHVSANSCDSCDTRRLGLDPYPIALRCIDWVKFFCRYPECATKPRIESLYSQLRLLEKELEYHLLGNHLLEDAYSLFIGSVYFQDDKLGGKAYRLLISQLKEQTLSDGAHYEQSVMYHCILLDRLLDCINISAYRANLTSYILHLTSFAEQMLGHLESIVWEDGSIPLLNDAAEGIAPAPSQIFDYARRLGLQWKAIPLGECGYRKMKNERIEAVMDVGNITATYQPGHSHADSLNYELHIDGNPFVIDTGISTYDKTPRRQFERSTAAHNCVMVEKDTKGTGDYVDSSQVWGGFRVGKRCNVTLMIDKANEVVACHNGYGKKCKRRFAIEDGKFVVEDTYDGNAVSLIHLVVDADTNRIKIEGARKVEMADEKYSVEYNRFLSSRVMKIYFMGKVKYTIQ